MVKTDGKPTIAWKDVPHELAQILPAQGDPGDETTAVDAPPRPSGDFCRTSPDLSQLKRREVRRRLNRAIAQSSVVLTAELIREATSAVGPFALSYLAAERIAGYLLGEPGLQEQAS